MMGRLEFEIDQDEESNVFVASWDDPAGGGITTQAKTLPELYNAIQESVRCHFGDRPASIAPKTLQSILKQAQITVEELKEAL